MTIHTLPGATMTPLSPNSRAPIVVSLLLLTIAVLAWPGCSSGPEARPDNTGAAANTNRRATSNANANNPGNVPGSVAVENANVIRQVEAARAALADNRNSAVVQILDKVLDTNDDLPAAFYYRGEAHRRLQHHEPAESDLHAALALQSDYVVALISLGRLLMETDRQKEAITRFSAALRRDPAVTAGFQLRGRAHEALGQLADAEADFSVVIKRLTDEPEPWFDRGRVRFAAGNVTGATSDLDEAVKFEKPPLAALLLRARLAAADDDLFRARDLLSRALRAEPDSPDVLMLRADLTAGHDDEAAVTDLDAVLELVAAESELALAAHRLRLACTLRLKQPLKVVDDANALIAVESDNVDLRLIRANASVHTGVLFGALDDLLTVLRLAPDRVTQAADDGTVNLVPPATGWVDDSTDIWRTLAASADGLRDATDDARVDAWFALLALLFRPTVNEMTQLPGPLQNVMAVDEEATPFVQQLLDWLQTMADTHESAGNWHTLLIAATGVGRDKLLASAAAAFADDVSADHAAAVADAIRTMMLVGGDDAVAQIRDVAERYAANDDLEAVRLIINAVHLALRHLVDPAVQPDWRGRFATADAIRTLLDAWAKRIDGDDEDDDDDDENGNGGGNE